MPATPNAPQPEDRAGAAASGSLTCERCHQVIGVYEPVMVAEGGLVRETSRAAEPGLGSAGDRALYHGPCFALLHDDATGFA